MRFGAFARGPGASGFGFPRGNGLGRSERGARCVRARGGAGSVIEAIESKPLLKSALVCAGLGCVGDTVAQRREAGERARSAATAKGKVGKGKQPPAASDAHDFQRTLKQALYNFFFYGPVQHHWYIALAAKFPAKAFTLTAERRRRAEQLHLLAHRRRLSRTLRRRRAAACGGRATPTRQHLGAWARAPRC